MPATPLCDQDTEPQLGVRSVPSEASRSEKVATCHGPGALLAQSLAAMAAERRPRSDDPAELVARVSAAKRDVLLRVHRHRLGFEDLEDCFSQATLELVTRARTRARAFVSEAHIANALEQRFLSRISDRRRAVSGRSPIQAATHAALRPARRPGGRTARRHRSPPSPTRRPMWPAALADRDDVRRLRELADELTADQRLVLACQVALDMDCQEFCARFGWSAEKFRKVAQRARARLRVLVADYEAGERCRGLADDLAAYVAHVAGGEQSERVRRHLTNCPACAHTARELERVARGVGALLPLPPTVDPEVVHRFGGGGAHLRARAAVLGLGRERGGGQGRRGRRGGRRRDHRGRLGRRIGGSQARCHGTVRGRSRGRLRRLRPDRALQRTAAARAPPHRDDREPGPRGATQAPSILGGRHACPCADHPHDPTAARHEYTERAPWVIRCVGVAFESGQQRVRLRGRGGDQGLRSGIVLFVESVGACRQRRGAISADDSVLCAPAARGDGPEGVDGVRVRVGARVDHAPPVDCERGRPARTAAATTVASRWAASRNAPGVTPKRRRKALTKCEGWR